MAIINTIQHRRGTAAQLDAAVGEILAAGEMGYITDTNEVIFGDAVTEARLLTRFKLQVETAASDLNLTHKNVEYDSGTDSYPASSLDRPNTFWGPREPTLGVESLNSKDFWVPTIDLTITNLTASGTGLTRTLAWTPPDGATAIKVYRASLSGGPYTLIETLAGNAITTQVTLPGQDAEYHYVVTASINTIEGAYSNEVVLVDYAAGVGQWNPTEDTYVRAGANSANNYNSEGYIHVKHDNNDDLRRWGLLKFDLGAESVNTATLRLHVTSKDSYQTTFQARVVEVANTLWSEGTATFATYDGVNAWALETLFSWDAVNKDSTADIGAKDDVDSADVGTYIDITLTFAAPVTGEITLGLYCPAFDPGNFTSSSVIFADKLSANPPILIKLT